VIGGFWPLTTHHSPLTTRTSYDLTFLHSYALGFSFILHKRYHMDQRLTFITLGVQNIAKMSGFYKEKFGWQPLLEMEGTVFFKLNGIILALFPSDELAKDAGIKMDTGNWKQMSLAINFSSEEEVRRAVDSLRLDGVKVVKEPQSVFWGGYHAYVEDPELNLWELAYNPFLTMDDQGNVLTHA
jgi:uncharacterized protein